MNSSERWAQHFVNYLECVKCRTPENLTLYNFNGKKVDVAHMTIDELRRNVDKMDVWCESCKPKVNTRVAGPGRKEAKREAAQLANIYAKLDPGSDYDQHVLETGHRLTKIELVDRVKARPCSLCEKMYPAPVMQFYHVVLPKKANIASLKSFTTIRELIDEIEKCVLLCANCTKLVEHKYAEAPKEAIIRLDGNFWASVG